MPEVRIGDLWENRCAGKPTRRCRVIGFRDGDALLENRDTNRISRVRTTAFNSSGHWYLIRSGPKPKPAPASVDVELDPLYKTVPSESESD